MVKRLLQILSTTALGIGLSIGLASADGVTCGVSNTGPGSTNAVTCVDSNNVKVSCNNNVVVSNNNSQSSNSGSASSSDNTTSGGASSGSSNNNNNATVNVGASCAPVAAGSTTFTTTAAPSGGKGSGTTTPSTSTPAASAVASLPATGSNTAKEVTLAGGVLLGSALAISRFGVMAYRRFAIK